VYGTLGRKNDSEVVLTRYLKAVLVKFNKDLPQQAYEDAVRQIVEYPATQSLIQINQGF
jgi:type I restriction enzyme R subunit